MYAVNVIAHSPSLAIIMTIAITSGLSAIGVMGYLIWDSGRGGTA